MKHCTEHGESIALHFISSFLEDENICYIYLQYLRFIAAKSIKS
jgi:hypothetical protein